MRNVNHVLRFVVVTAAALLVLRATASTQRGALAAGRVSHVGVVTPNIEATLQQYGRVMGFPVPKVNTYPIPMPDGRKAEFKLATLYMPNFFIELNEPVNHVGPYYEHLQAYGMSIQHMGLAVPGEGSIDGERSTLEQQGGRWVLGEKGSHFAYVNFQPMLGTTLEVIHDTTKPGPAPPLPAGDAVPPLGALPVTHVGFAATDATAVVGGFAKVLGIMSPRVTEYKDSQYPLAATWNRSATLRLASWNQGGMGVEVIESVGGPTPWSEYVTRQKGAAAQHLAINVGNRMDEMIRDLVAKGGKWTNGKHGGSYAYLDFMDTLGLVFELNGTSKSGGK